MQMPAFASLRNSFVGFATLAMLGACASGGGSRTPKEPVNLSGHWQRDASASDDAQGLLADAFASARQGGAGHGGKRGMRGGGGGGMGGGMGGGGMGGGMGGGRGGMGGGRGGMGGGGSGGSTASGGGHSSPEQLHKQLDQFVLPADKLDVEQQERDIHMVYDTDRVTRTLTPGEKSTIINERGSADVQPGWKGTTLTVHTTIGGKLTVDEEYAMAKNGSELVETMKLSGGSMKAVTIRSVYRKQLQPIPPPPQGAGKG